MQDITGRRTVKAWHRAPACGKTQASRQDTAHRAKNSKHIKQIEARESVVLRMKRLKSQIVKG
ncbi:MAG: hypothetical protein KA114_01640 [Bacteroidales bacterium]|nr:hypothetical protein [Bacteroidales bacterium]